MKKVAKTELKKILYKNESTFTFDKYVTNLKKILNVLEKYGVTLYEEQMVENLIDQIMSPNTELKTEVNIFSSSHLPAFTKESTYLSTVVARFYPSSDPSSGRFGKRSIYDTGRGYHDRGRCGHFNGIGCGI